LGNINWHCGVETFEEDPPAGHDAHYLCKGCQEKGEGGKNMIASAVAALGAQIHRLISPWH